MSRTFMPGSRGRSALAFARRLVARDEVRPASSALASFSSVAETQGFSGAAVGTAAVGGCVPAAPLPAIGSVIASAHDQARDRPGIVSKRLPEIMFLREADSSLLSRLVFSAFGRQISACGEENTPGGTKKVGAQLTGRFEAIRRRVGSQLAHYRLRC